MEMELNFPVLSLLDTHPQSLKMLAFYGCRLKKQTTAIMDLRTAYYAREEANNCD
jgi:hypothetical protein